MTWLRNGIVYVLSFLMVMPPQWTLAADAIVVESGASVTTTPSGKPMLNIKAPNGAGVSHNTFTNFNVTNQGLVINNATNIAATSIGGVIEANPKFSGRAASLIINEVTSSNRSELTGATEIGGQAADYILANSNGITCNGCGFINTPRATLTTGTPTFSGNALSGLSVNTGDVVIEGLGLDASKATKFDIVTRAATINAQVNAKDLGIFTGRQDFDYESRTGTAKDDNGSTQPDFAIDSTALGGMYAGRITLVGTEAGLGVRVAGDMAASTGGMVLTADGKLELKSNLSAATDIALTSTNNNVVVEQDIYAGGDATATASNGTVTASEDASLGAAGDVTVKADTVTAGDGAKIVAGMDSGGALTTSGTLDVHATTQIATGDGFLGGGAAVKLKGPTVDLSRASDDTSETVRSRGTLTIESGNLAATNGRIASDGAMTLKGNSPIVLGEGTYASPTTITLTGDSVTSAATLTSDDAVNITSTSGDITNTGSMTAGTSATLNSAADITNSGTIESQTGTTVTAAGTLANSSGAKIKSAQATEVSAGTAIDNAGSIYAVGANTVSAPTITNSGSLAAGTDLTIKVTSFTNEEGVLHAEDNITVSGFGGASLAALFDNASAFVETVNGDINISAETIKNRKKALDYTLRQYSSITTDSYPYPPSSLVRKQGVGSCIKGTSSCGYNYRVIFYTPIGTTGPIGFYSGKPKFWYTDVSLNQNSSSGFVSSGQNINLTASSIDNLYSTISARENITLNTEAFSNEGLTGTSTFSVSNVYGSPVTKVFISLSDVVFSADALIQAGQSISISASGDAGNGTERAYELPSSWSHQIAASELFTSPTRSNLKDTTDYADLIPGRDALFNTVKDPTATFLFETDVDFINVGNFYGSDYFISKLPELPEDISTRLGDAYFDTTLVKQTILRETGQRWLDNAVKDDIQQMKTLMDNGLAAQSGLELSFGIELSQDQINALTQDIVWYVEEEYQGQTVLIPKVYLASATRASLTDSGAILSAEGDITITADTINNDQSVIKADGDVTLTATGDLTSNSAKIKAGNDVTIASTDGDVNITTQVDTFRRLEARQTVMHERSTVEAGGNLSIDAGNDVTVLAADLKAGGNATVTAIGDATIGTRELQFRNMNDSSTDTVGSNVMAGGDLTVTSGGDARIKASNLKAENDATVQATGNVVVESGQDTFFDEGDGYTLQTVTQKHATIEAGGNIQLASLAGNASVISSTLDSGGTIQINTPNGALYLGARKDLYDYREQSSSEGLLTATYTNRGEIHDTVVPTLMTADGNIAIVTKDGVIVDYKDTGSLEDSIDQLSQAPGLAWMKDLQARTDVQWNAVQETHQSWDYSSQGISPMGAIIISAAVAYATAGMGAELAGIVAEGSAGTAGLAIGDTIIVGTGTSATTATIAGSSTVAMVNTGFTTIVNQATTAFVGNNGDIGATLKQLGSMSSLKSLATSVVTAGLVAELPLKEWGLDTSKTAPLTHKLGVEIAKATVSTIVDSAVNGKPLDENLKGSLVNAALTAVSQSAFQTVGDIAMANDLPEGSLQKVALHALTGCAIGQASSKSCMAGAMAAGLQEFAGDALEEINADPNKQSQLAGLLGTLAVAITGGDVEDVNTAASIAQTANAFNRQLHTEEIQAIEEKAKELAEQGADGLTQEQWEARLGQAALREVDRRLGENIDADPLADQIIASMAKNHGAAFIDGMAESFKFLQRDQYYENTNTFSLGLLKDQAFYDNALSGWAENTYGSTLPDGIGASALALVSAVQTAPGCGSGFESCAGNYALELQLLDPTQSALTNGASLVEISDALSTTWLKLGTVHGEAKSTYENLQQRLDDGDPTVTQTQVDQAHAAYLRADAAMASTFRAASSAVDVADGLVSDAQTRKVIEDGYRAIEDSIRSIPDLPQDIADTLLEATSGAEVLARAAQGDEAALEHLSQRGGEIWESIKGLKDVPDHVEAQFAEADALYKAGDFEGAGQIYGAMSAFVGGALVEVVKPNKAQTLVKVVEGLSNLKTVVKIKKAISRARAVDAKIKWDGGIQDQGIPWEDHLAKDLPEEVRLPQNFKTFDFWDNKNGLAISAKTLNTQTASRLSNPKQILGTVKQQINSTLKFETATLSKKTVNASEIKIRRLELAVPHDTTKQQWLYLQQAVEYGQQNGVDVIITKVK